MEEIPRDSFKEYNIFRDFANERIDIETIKHKRCPSVGYEFCSWYREEKRK